MATSNSLLPIKRLRAAPAVIGRETVSGDQATLELLKTLNSTSQSARKSWLSFLVLMAYLFAAVASVTHVDLLLNTPVRLPLLQISVALNSFFLIAPILFILIHLGVLLHHATLRHKALTLDSTLRRSESHDNRPHRLRVEVSSYFFTQKEVGPQHSVLWILLLRSITFLTLNIIPLCLLLYFQIAFLPVHDAEITFYQQLYVLTDILVMLLVIIAQQRFREARLSRLATLYLACNLLSWCAVLFISFCVATLPTTEDSTQVSFFNFDQTMADLMPVKIPYDASSGPCQKWQGDRCAFWLTALIFEQPIDYVSGRRPWFSRNLVVTDKEIPRPTSNPDGSVVQFSLRGRDLRYATFDRTNFANADFTAADLTGASLIGAKLKDAVFGCAVRGKRLIAYVDENGIGRTSPQDVEECAKLRYANLSGAELPKGSFSKIGLVGVNFSRTNLEGFDFSFVDLSLASFSSADVRGANFSNAHLDGADFSDALADGSLFSRSYIRSANLDRSHLMGADFQYSDLSGASLRDADLTAANMSHVLLFGADLNGAHVWQTAPSEQKAYTLADLSNLQLHRPTEQQILEITDSVKSLALLPRWEGAAPERLTQVVDERRTVAWGNTDEAKLWKKLILEARLSGHADSAVGTYIGDLACSKEILFLAVRQTYFGFDIYDTYSPYLDEHAILPPGVSSADLLQLSDFGGQGGDGCCRFGDAKYGDRKEFTKAFYERVKLDTCESAKHIAPQMIETLRPKVEEMSSEELRKSTASGNPEAH